MVHCTLIRIHRVHPYRRKFTCLINAHILVERVGYGTKAKLTVTESRLKRFPCVYMGINTTLKSDKYLLKEDHFLGK